MTQDVGFRASEKGEEKHCGFANFPVGCLGQQPSSYPIGCHPIARGDPGFGFVFRMTSWVWKQVKGQKTQCIYIYIHVESGGVNAGRVDGFVLYRSHPVTDIHILAYYGWIFWVILKHDVYGWLKFSYYIYRIYIYIYMNSAGYLRDPVRFLAPWEAKGPLVQVDLPVNFLMVVTGPGDVLLKWEFLRSWNHMWTT